MPKRKTQKYPKIHRMAQRSDEWFAIRKGKMTASHAQTIATNGKGLETYIYEILTEKYELQSDDQGYLSADMSRGVELEDQARMTYEIEYSDTEQVGFIEMDEYVGCSPDGLVGENGGVEIKCVNNKNFFRLLVDGEPEINPKYWWQCQMSMLVSGRSSWDLVFYNQNFSPNIIVFSFVPDAEAFEKLRIGIEKGKKIIMEIENKYNT